MSPLLILAKASSCLETLLEKLAGQLDPKSRRAPRRYWCLDLFLAAILVSFGVTTGVAQTWVPAPGWAQANLGGATGGSQVWDGTNTYKLVGNGTGMMSTGDQMFFTSTNIVGDFQLTAHVVSATGPAGAHAGIAVRQNTSATCAYAGGASYIPNVNSGTLTGIRVNSFGVYSRKTTAPQDNWFTVANPSDMGPSCWLRFTRVGNDFVVYKSSDNTTWSTIYNTSGGAFVESGTIQIGLFVATGTGSMASPASAVFDNVTVTPSPQLEYESSWIGNTAAAASTGYVSANAKAMWVSPEGTCYVNGAGDETGQSAKIYDKNGVVKRIDSPPTGGGWEGSITGNYVGTGTGSVFLTGSVNSLSPGIFQVDLNGANAVPMYLSNPPSLDSIGLVMVSGMVYGNDHLYLSNPVDGKIYVSGTIRNSHGTQPRYMTNKVYSGSLTFTGSSYPAPPEVYQSQFQSTSMKFDFGGFSGTLPLYMVRLHFAEFEASGTARSMTIKIGPRVIDTNYKSPAQGFADVLNISDVAPVSGTISVVVNSNVTGVNGILNGIEILSTGSSSGDNTAYNCGGPKVTGTDGEVWEGSINETANFALSGSSMTRPGPLAIDKRGDLWVVQEGGPFPTSDGKFDVPVGQASISCFSATGTTAGTYQNKIITGLTNPTAICYDGSGTNDRLLVTEDGIDQNIRIYTNLTSATPTCTGTFGATKGVFSGTNPGLVYDPADHGYARLYGPTGVGLDNLGQLYVVCNPGQNVTDLKAFKSTSDETLLWKQQALEFCNVGDFDPLATGPSDIWTPAHHYTMDYSGTTPGGEWTLKSYLWNPFLISGSAARVEPRSAAVTAVYRKLGSSQTPFMYTCGQGALMAHSGTGADAVNYGMDLFRFQGEQLIRCGEITYGSRAMTIWSDTNRNGIEVYLNGTGGGLPDEPKTSFHPRDTSNGQPTSFDVASNGDVYFSMSGTGPQPYVLKLAAQMDSYGVPSYSGSAAGNVQTLIPTGTTTVVSGTTVRVGNSYFTEPQYGGHYWGAKAHLRYDETNDTMYLEGPANPDAANTNKNFGGYLERWDNWSGTSAPRSMHFGIKLPDPSTSTNFQNGAPPYSEPDGFCYQAMDVANGYTFISDNWGAIQVIDPEGTVVTKLMAGPGVSGVYGWCDAVMGLRAHYNANANEYIVTQECAGFHIRQNLFRWVPAERLFFADFQTSGTSPFVVSTATGGTSCIVAYANGNKAVEFQDSSVAGENLTSDFKWTLPSTHPLVQRINQVLTGTAGTPAKFAYSFSIRQSLQSNSRATVTNGMAYLEASPNDGNPPMNGAIVSPAGRDRFWSGLQLSGTTPAYTTSHDEGRFIRIDRSTFPKGNDPTKPWRGFCFTVTPDGTHRPISNLTIGFQARVNSAATPEAFQVDNIAVDQVP